MPCFRNVPLIVYYHSESESITWLYNRRLWIYFLIKIYLILTKWILNKELVNCKTSKRKNLKNLINMKLYKAHTCHRIAFSEWVNFVFIFTTQQCWRRKGRVEVKSLEKKPASDILRRGGLFSSIVLLTQMQACISMNSYVLSTCDSTSFFSEFFYREKNPANPRWRQKYCWASHVDNFF